MSWSTAACHCRHPIHEGHCPVVACGCYVAPPTCPICYPHREHGSGKDCFAGGVREAHRCLCKGPGKTTRKELEEDAFGPRGRNR